MLQLELIKAAVLLLDPLACQRMELCTRAASRGDGQTAELSGKSLRACQ